MKYTTASTRKVTWSNKVHITLDTEAAYYAATQHADVFTITDKEETIPSVTSSACRTIWGTRCNTCRKNRKHSQCRGAPIPTCQCIPHQWPQLRQHRHSRVARLSQLHVLKNKQQMQTRRFMEQLPELRDIGGENCSATHTESKSRWARQKTLPLRPKPEVLAIMNSP